MIHSVWRRRPVYRYTASANSSRATIGAMIAIPFSRSTPFWTVLIWSLVITFRRPASGGILSVIDAGRPSWLLRSPRIGRRSMNTALPLSCTSLDLPSTMLMNC